jgi:hypothetical protein
VVMISKAKGAVCAVESTCHQWKQFVEDFRGRRGYLRCRIHASPVEVVSLKISESQGVFVLSNACVTRGSSFVEDFRGRTGCLRCRIHASPVEAVSLTISETAGAVCAVECMRHQWKQFR